MSGLIAVSLLPLSPPLAVVICLVVFLALCALATMFSAPKPKPSTPPRLTPALDLPLERTLFARTPGGLVKARLGTGASFVPRERGQGVEPGEGPAVEIDAPTGIWSADGALSLCFSLSEAITEATPPTFRIPLLESASALLELRGTRLAFRLSGGEAGGRSEALLPIRRLAAGKVYQVTLAWRAREGKIDAYLNGAFQRRCVVAPWTVPESPDILRLGGTDLAAKATVSRLAVFALALEEEDIEQLARAAKVPALSGEALCDAPASLDLGVIQRSNFANPNLEMPLSALEEAKLIRDGQRVATGERHEWIVEGAGRAWTDAGRLLVAPTESGGAPAESGPGEAAAAPDEDDVVVWFNRELPAEFLLEFEIRADDFTEGRAGVMFAAAGAGGASLFDYALAPRQGIPARYADGDITCLQAVAWNARRAMAHGQPVRLCRRPGGAEYALGPDRLAGQAPGPHRVRLLCARRTIALEVRRRVVLQCALPEDEPAPAAGRLGFFQSRRAGQVAYSGIRIFRIL